MDKPVITMEETVYEDANDEDLGDSKHLLVDIYQDGTITVGILEENSRLVLTPKLARALSSLLHFSDTKQIIRPLECAYIGNWTLVTTLPDPDKLEEALRDI